MSDRLRIFAALCVCVLLAGCLPAPTADTEPVQPAPQGTDMGQVDLPAVPPPPIRPGPVQGSGTISYTQEAGLLTGEQETLLLDYMHTYFLSLASLELQDASLLFAPDASKQAAGVRDVWEVDIAIRAMQGTDLSLTGYSFTLTCQSVKETDEGYWDVRVSEDNTQNFAAYPGVDSETYGISHIFTLCATADGWRLRQHRQFMGANNILSGMRWGGDEVGPATKHSVLQQAGQDTAGRGTQGSEPGEIRADHPYDRQAAVVYAREWVGKRHPDWQPYDRMGGNCQNFTSQAILAGGIPMDHVAPGQWKWYGDMPNTDTSPTGRSPAWTGVNDFLAYVRGNEGFGMAAYADAPFYSGEPGDIIHLGTAGRLRHTVMVTEVMTDSEGNVVDYLVCSNTADLRDYPVSAYHYTNQLLIKIYGWNNA